MSLKINVIYKGIIYRVKGIKVLCSVVLAVIILLVAIVAMGVWMLINVYDDEGAKITFHNSSYVNLVKTAKPANQAPSIEFDKSEHIVSSDILLHNIRNKSDRKSDKSVGNSMKPSSPPESELYGAAFYNTGRKDSSVNHRETFSERDTLDDTIVKEDPNSTTKTTINSNSEWERNVEEIKRLPPYLIPRNINTAILSKNSDYNQNSENSKFHELKYPIITQTTERGKVNRSLIENRRLQPKRVGKVSTNLGKPTKIPTTTTTQFFRRNGAPSEDTLTYVGPPVVGYGSNPYEVLTRERIKEYDSFWRTYAGNKSGNKSHIFKGQGSKFKIEDAIRTEMRPHLRGLRPTGVEYDLPVRPDAQAPSKVKLGRRPLPQRRRNPSQNNPNRKLSVVDQTQPSRLKTRPRPNLPLLGPLQDLYDYSKKLAASLLSFNSKSADQIRDSSEKLAEYGINLIENHNQVFKQPTGGPLDRIVALIPSAERLRSLDPFELSLVTWTFLDFWEFLIEKVGTLSDEDLSLLQERLEKLRKRKDDTMTRVFVNETLTRYSPSKPRSISHNQSANVIGTQHLIKPENSYEKNNEEKVSLDGNVSLTPFIPTMYDQILGKLFPNIAKVDPHEENKQESPLTIQERSETEEKKVMNSTLKKLVALLNSPDDQHTRSSEISSKTDASDMTAEGRAAAWDPLGLFTSEARMQFMQFAVKVLFNFGKVYLKKPYALDCSMLLFCKDLNQNTKKGGIEAMAAKLKSVGLKVLTESDQQLRESDTLNQVWRSVTAWTPLQCDAMFPRCDGPKALEIVNEVALGDN